MTGFPSASVLGWQSSRLPTARTGIAEVSRRARGARPCPRQMSTHDQGLDVGDAKGVCYAPCCANNVSLACGGVGYILQMDYPLV